MKKLLILTGVILLLTLSNSFAQIHKFRATTISIKEKNNGAWGNWSPSSPYESLITHNLDNFVFTIHGENKTSFYVSTTEPPDHDNQGRPYIVYHAVDDYGVTCAIKMLKLLTKDNKRQLYLIYPTEILLITMVPIN